MDQAIPTGLLIGGFQKVMVGDWLVRSGRPKIGGGEFLGYALISRSIDFVHAGKLARNTTTAKVDLPKVDTDTRRNTGAKRRF